MQNPLRRISTLTVCVTSILIALLACGDHKDSLNENDRAQVAQAAPTNANTPGPIASREVVAVNAPSSTPQVEFNANISRPPGATTTAVMRPPNREEVENNKKHYQQLARDQGRTIGNGPDDAWLWVKTRHMLVFSIPDSSINVDVDNGVVTLTGTVANQEQVKEAESLVREIEGVRSVQNSLIVGPLP
jgi:hypothetical protein